MMNSVNIFYKDVAPKLSNISFISDEVLNGHIEKIYNQIDGIDSLEGIDGVLKSLVPINTALSSSNYYVERNIDIDSNAVIIEELLISLDDLVANLKKDKAILLEVVPNVKERIARDVKDNDTLESLYYDEIPNVRFPNSTSRFN